MKKQRTIVSNFILVTVLVLIAKALGMARDVIIAPMLGTGAAADVYARVSVIPTYIFTAAATAISMVNVPTLAQIEGERGAAGAKRYVSALYAQILAFAGGASLLVLLLSRPIASAMSHGAGEAQLTALLLAIAAPSLLMVSLAYLSRGILNTRDHFATTSLVSVPSNIIIIGAALMPGADVRHISVAATVGWGLQFLMQAPQIYKDGFRPFTRFRFEEKADYGIYRPLPSIILGNIGLHICFTAGIMLSGDSASALRYANTLIVTVTGIFAISLATVSFPAFSRLISEKNSEKVRLLLSYNLKLAAVMLVPLIVAAVGYGHDIIRLLYERGNFDAASTASTGTAFSVYAFSFVGYFFQEIFNGFFYAKRNYRVPALLTLGALAVNIALILPLRGFGIAGAAASTTLSSVAYAAAMAFFAEKEAGRFLNADLAAFMLKLAVPAAAMALSVALIKLAGVGALLPLAGIAGGRLAFVAPLGAAMCVYVGLCLAMGLIRDVLAGRKAPT
ncbi:MAG: oligosaccharide flippase family protein [Clostridiales bacterium]|nr:oligosaccharide flippase family protein [Clostridiales bacterium]